LQAAIPCGLIVNELVTNAFKHAFPSRSSGRIVISAERAEDQSLQIEVSDDGIGLPNHPDWENSKTLGFQLIPMLTEQLDGTLRLMAGPGTHVRVNFMNPRDAKETTT